MTKVRRQVEMNFGEPVPPEPALPRAEALNLLTDNLVELETVAPEVRVERSYVEGKFVMSYFCLTLYTVCSKLFCIFLTQVESFMVVLQAKG